MHANRFITSILCLFLILSSCSGPLAMISIEVLQPAAVTYPENIQTVGYLNRSPRTFNTFHRVNVDSLTVGDLLIIDTLICNGMRRGFIEGKSNSQLSYLEEMVYLEARRTDTLFKGSPVSDQKVTEICKSFQLDALITQDYYSFEFDQTHMWNGEYMEFVRMLIQEAKWTLSVPGHAKPLDSYVVNDTLYYGNQAKKGQIRYLTPMEMLSDGSYVLGYIYGKRNIPIWSQLSRGVFIGGQKELKEASAYTDEGDWEKAHHLWSQNLSSQDKKLAAKSAHNIALYYELEDEIEQAIAFARQAHELWPASVIETYKQELELRLLNKKDIHKQMRIASQ